MLSMSLFVRFAAFERASMCLRACGIFLRELFDDVVGRITALARRMSKATGAVVVRPVENHVVVMVGRGDHRHGIEPQLVAYLPGHDVVGARSIAAQAKTADDFSFVSYKGKPPPKTITPPMGFPTMGSSGVPKVVAGPNTACAFGGALVARLYRLCPGWEAAKTLAVERA